MKHTTLPLTLEHHHIQDGNGGIINSKIYKNTPDNKAIFLCEIHWNEELADSLVHRYNCYEKLVEACQKVVNNWGNLHPKDRQQLRQALAKTQGK